MFSFLLPQKRPLNPGTPVNRGYTATAPARYDGVVVADFGNSVLVEWPRLGQVRESKRQLTAIQA